MFYGIVINLQTIYGNYLWQNFSNNGGDMNINPEKIKKIFIMVLIAAVAVLVVFALYSNKSRFFSSSTTVKYSSITIDENTDINDIISEYSSKNGRDKLISQIKEVNNLSSLSDESVYGKTLYIPV